MLGVTIRFDSYKEAEDQVIRILEVEANSPADIAGLQPNSDYLLGTAERVLLFLIFLDLQMNCFESLSLSFLSFLLFLCFLGF
jgi:hypothetical protein